MEQYLLNREGRKDGKNDSSWSVDGSHVHRSRISHPKVNKEVNWKKVGICNLFTGYYDRRTSASFVEINPLFLKENYML